MCTFVTLESLVQSTFALARVRKMERVNPMKKTKKAPPPRLKVASLTITDNKCNTHTVSIKANYIATTCGDVASAAYLMACIFTAGGDSALTNHLKNPNSFAFSNLIGIEKAKHLMKVCSITIEDDQHRTYPIDIETDYMAGVNDDWVDFAVLLMARIFTSGGSEALTEYLNRKDSNRSYNPFG